MSNDRALWLALFVLIVYATVIFSSVGMCIYHGDSIVSGSFECDSTGRIQKMLEQMLTFVGAFLAGKYSGGKQ